MKENNVAKNTNASEPVGTLHAIVIDVNDLERCAGFWSKVLGKEISFKVDNYCRIGKGDDRPSLLLQKVPEQHKHKNRAHIDLDVKNLELAVQRVVDLGGTKLAEFSEYGIRWAVMADPDGNEFCLVRHS
jgi:predicted enzyme related to lactoylglutathione lyase